MESDLHIGQIVSWKDDRGFGFIRPSAGGQEIFLHISGLKNAARRPQIGDTIFYRIAIEQNGKLRAHNARIVGATAAATAEKNQTRDFLLSPAGRAILLLSAIPILGAIHFTWTTRNPLPLILYFAMSWLTFGLYAKDKSSAQKRQWRIQEKRLHLCELMGGWIGAFVAQRTLRHKISKSSYQRVFRAIVAIHNAFWLGWLLFGKAAIESF